MEDKVNLTLLIEIEMTHYSTEPRNKERYRKQLLNTGVNASKKVIHKAAKETGYFLGNKITDAVTKSNDNKTLKTEHVINVQEMLKI